MFETLTLVWKSTEGTHDRSYDDTKHISCTKIYYIPMMLLMERWKLMETHGVIITGLGSHVLPVLMFCDDRSSSRNTARFCALLRTFAPPQ